MKSLIFGASGQDGVYLRDLLESRSIEVIPYDRTSGVPLGDYQSVRNIIRANKPDHIFHFAANSTTHRSAWQENHLTIVEGGLNILGAVYEESPSTKVFITGSGLQFRNTGQPISEKNEFYAGSAYALSRIQSVYSARYYRMLGVRAYVGYLFNHDSPLRKERHINQQIVAAAKRIAEGVESKIEIGDLSVEKEFGFAGDIMEAVWALVNQESVFEAAIGTGKVYSIKDWAALVFSHYNLNWEEYITPGKNYEVVFKKLVSDPSTICSLGWKPRTSISELAEMMCNR